MKPVMASLRAKYGAQLTYHYHEFNQPESQQVNRDFEIRGHPQVFILDRRGRLIKRLTGLVPLAELESAILPLLPVEGR